MSKQNHIVGLEGYYDTNGKPVIRPAKPADEIDLNKWKWLREISGNDTEATEYYVELARKNEVFMVKIFNKDAYNIYTRMRKS
jgi:hypothetical protein